MIRPELVRIGVQVDDRVQIISELADLLCDLGYVKETFRDAVLARENEFPTGLPTGDICLAIPHADSIHVKESAVAVALLDSPVNFQQMGDPERLLPVQIVLMLAIKDPKAIVPFLARTCSVFQDQLLLSKLLGCRREDQVVDLLEESLIA